MSQKLCCLSFHNLTRFNQNSINRERHYNPRVADALDKMEAMVGFLLFLANLSELSSTSVRY